MRQFVIDYNCIFLLCSDGLSDRQRVEECWETELLPVLEGKVELAVASRRLIDKSASQKWSRQRYCQVA